MSTVAQYINDVADGKTRRALQAIFEEISVSSTLALKQLGTEITSTAAELNIMDGCTKTYSQINALVQGVAAGYKLARGSKVVTATASIATGLTTIVGFAITDRANTAAKANYAPHVSGKIGSIAGALKFWRWKHTSAGTTTLVAATSAGTLDWLAVGT